jgi:hypothetical protein
MSLWSSLESVVSCIHPADWVFKILYLERGDGVAPVSQDHWEEQEETVEVDDGVSLL